VCTSYVCGDTLDICAKPLHLNLYAHTLSPEEPSGKSARSVSCSRDYLREGPRWVPDNNLGAFHLELPKQVEPTPGQQEGIASYLTLCGTRE
jgi:hypothetical protein